MPDTRETPQTRPVISQPLPVIRQPIIQRQAINLSKLQLEAAYKRTVNIVSGSGKNTHFASGVILTPELIMTAGYIFDAGSPKLSIESSDRSLSISNYNVKYFSRHESDKEGIAIIVLDKPIEKLSPPAPSIAVPAKSDIKVTLIGFKLGKDKVISEGVARASGSPAEFFHTSQSTGGMGGGPIIDQTSGNIIGVHFGRVNGLSNDKLAYPITSDIQAFVKKHK